MTTAQKDVGILAMEVYFPEHFVRQEELEKAYGVAAGKFTIGLGQTELATPGVNEDSTSMAMTAVSRLMANNHDSAVVTWDNVGRVEVGTESNVDKSKSIKSCVMSLFAQRGNHEVEGVDSTNACYGGTAALFNSAAWVESSFYRPGTVAIVVATDVAAYADGPARPTGGCGAVAIAIGPNAPLILEPGHRASFFDHTYDFYKPRSGCDYPVVDAGLSIATYFRAVDETHRLLASRMAAAGTLPQDSGVTDACDHVVFHSPYNKLVQKAAARLAFLDARHRRQTRRQDENDDDGDLPQTPVAPFFDTPLTSLYTDKGFEKAAAAAAKEFYATKVAPGTMLSKRVGNCYTASLYIGLASLLWSLRSTPAADTAGRRILLFSYGSGAAASLFTLRVTGDIAPLVAHWDLDARLDARQEITPDVFTAALNARHAAIGAQDYDIDASHQGYLPVTPGTFQLEGVDGDFRRSYFPAEATPPNSEASSDSDSEDTAAASTGTATPALGDEGEYVCIADQSGAYCRLPAAEAAATFQLLPAGLGGILNLSTVTSTTTTRHTTRVVLPYSS